MKKVKRNQTNRTIHILQNSPVPAFKSDNSNTPDGPAAVIPIDRTYTCYTNLSYDSDRPNHFLDLYVHHDADTVSYPTFIFVHGGGFVWGNKSEFAPKQKKGKVKPYWYFDSIVKAGFNVVTINYALAPGYLYPSPIVQFDQFIHYLPTLAAQYHLDPTRLVVAGNSGGAHIVGQYSAVQTNAAYAAELGMEQTLTDGQIKAVVLNSGLLDPERIGQAGFKAADWLFSKCGQAYFDCSSIPGNADAKQANIITHVTKDYPPVFMSDGNKVSFPYQARELSARLDELNVPHTLNIYPVEEGALFHDFEKTGNKFGKDNMKQILRFLSEVL